METGKIQWIFTIDFTEKEFGDTWPKAVFHIDTRLFYSRIFITRKQPIKIHCSQN